MSRGRGRRHNQLPVDDLVAIAVVGERADHGGSPAFSGVWHTHIVLGSARGGQVDGGGARSAPRTQKTPQTQQTQQWFAGASCKFESPIPDLGNRSAIRDPMAPPAEHDGSRWPSSGTRGPVVVPRETTPSSAPRAGSRENSSCVARSDVVLPFPIGIWRLHCSSMTNAYWIITEATHGFSTTRDARLTESERDIAD